MAKAENTLSVPPAFQSENDSPLLYEISAAASRLGISRALLYKLITAGAILTIKIGRRRLVSENAIRDFIAKNEGAEQ